MTRTARRLKRATRKKRSPAFAGLIGRLLACLWRSVFALLVLVQCGLCRAACQRREQALCQRNLTSVWLSNHIDRGLTRGKARLWAICHVVGEAPAVKIFDTCPGVRCDIRSTHFAEFFW